MFIGTALGATMRHHQKNFDVKSQLISDNELSFMFVS